MLGLLCSLALAADPSVPDPVPPARRHTSIVLVRTGEFAMATGVGTAVAGLVVAASGGGCAEDAGVGQGVYPSCGRTIFGAGMIGVGLAGVAVGLPVLVVGGLVGCKAAGQDSPESAIDCSRPHPTVEVGLGANGLLLRGKF